MQDGSGCREVGVPDTSIPDTYHPTPRYLTPRYLTPTIWHLDTWHLDTLRLPPDTYRLTGCSTLPPTIYHPTPRYHLPPDIYHPTGWISSREVGVPDLLDTLHLTSTIWLDGSVAERWEFLTCSILSTAWLDGSVAERWEFLTPRYHLPPDTYRLPPDWMQDNGCSTLPPTIYHLTGCSTLHQLAIIGYNRTWLDNRCRMDQQQRGGSSWHPDTTYRLPSTAWLARYHLPSDTSIPSTTWHLPSDWMQDNGCRKNIIRFVNI